MLCGKGEEQGRERRGTGRVRGGRKGIGEGERGDQGEGRESGETADRNPLKTSDKQRLEFWV